MLFLKGMAMGAADTVPGVSGGTIAFITNIYEELIYSIQRCNFHALKLLLQGKFKAGWQFINGNFLLTLFLGIVSAALLLANLITYLLLNYEGHIKAFFIGLILASALTLRQGVRDWNSQTVSLFAAGIFLAIAINFIPQTQGEVASWFIFISGAIAICAMILPGISGAFILVLLGSYETVLNALSNFDLVLLLIFMAGCLLGLIAFSNVLAYLLRRWHEQTMAALLGILLGSVQGLIPEQIDGGTSLSVWTSFVLLTMIGFALVYLLEKFTRTDA
ncbi:MAG: DUF368 domain-containing protein [Gammaproteobacteria bacterium]|nr:DUF368 domain-containing protein [Gammaproteobacteria bacterium]MAY03180.1 DUF368 domain-containing protein [Gammaproteobacteria bacterium]